MTIELLLWWVSGLLIWLPLVLYIYSIVKWETKPHIYTRFLYLVITLIICVIQMQNDWGYWSIALIVMTFFCFITFVLSFKYWSCDIVRSDKVFLFLGLIGIVFWVFVENDLYAVIVLIIVDLIATLPTIRKTYFEPTSENKYVYALEIFWLFFSILSLWDVNLLNSLYIFFLLLINIVIFLVIILWNMRILKNKWI